MLPSDIHNKTVLISPLDWGMGHSARCVVIMRELIQNNNKVFFAGDEQQLNFIRAEFPGIITVLLNGYGITLDSKKNTYLQLLRQSARLKDAIKQEQLWLAEFVSNENVDIIISDNRYGFRNDQGHSIIMTHQINLQLPSFGKIVSKKLAKYLNQFDECWVPDDDQQTLSGALSDGKLKIPITFIGMLCRFKKIEAKKKYNFLVILSGPEPERTNFGKTVLETLPNKKEKIAIVGMYHDGIDGITFFPPPVTSTELELLIAQSDVVIARAGYTTIMEMSFLEKPCILIATPGQYEQEYLAKTIVRKNIRFIKKISEAFE